MPTTLNDLIFEVESNLYAFGRVKDRVTSLTSAITAGHTVFALSSVADVTGGMMEITSVEGIETVYVSGVDAGSSTVTLHPWGRGQRGTTAIAHSAGSRVAIDPEFPRASIRAAINKSILGLYPTLFGVGASETNVTNGVTSTFPLPADADEILSVSAETSGPSGSWTPVRRYRLDTAAAAEYATAKTIDIIQYVNPNRKIRIVYRRPLTELALLTSPLTSSGLSESARQIVVLGAQIQMASPLDMARLISPSPEAAGENRGSRTSPLDSARRLMQMQQVAIDEERKRLERLYPPRTHMTS